MRMKKLIPVNIASSFKPAHNLHTKVSVVCFIFLTWGVLISERRADRRLASSAIVPSEGIRNLGVMALVGVIP